MSPQSKAHIRATNKYNKTNYERIEIVVKKGEKAKIKAHAESKGQSTNAYICSLIERDMKNAK